MTIELSIDHIDVSTGRIAPEYDVYLGEWFEARGYERALAQTSARAAACILAETYKGADALGIGLKWSLREYA